MKTKAKYAIVYAAVTLLLFSSLVYAQYPSGEHMRAAKDKEKKFENVVRELGLSPVQQEQLKNKRNEYAHKQKELREKLKQKMSELREKLEGYDTDRKTIAGIVAEVNALKGEQLKLRVDNIFSTKEILTPEQFEKFHKRIAIFKEPREEMQEKLRERKKEGRRRRFKRESF